MIYHNSTKSFSYDSDQDFSDARRAIQDKLRDLRRQMNDTADAEKRDKLNTRIRKSEIDLRILERKYDIFNIQKDIDILLDQKKKLESRNT